METFEQNSAGFILFKDNGERKYLLLKHGMNYWNFPKGKIESGESDLDAAKRELYEETGLDKIEIIDGFEEKFGYTFLVKEGLIKKVVKMFLAKYLYGSINLSQEHEEYQWYVFEDAVVILKFNNIRKSLKVADKYLSDK